MEILFISDIHGRFENIEQVFKQEKDFDLLVCNGDFIDMYALPEGFSEIYITDLVLQKLLVCHKPLLCIPGNHDIVESMELFEEVGCNLHGKVKKIGSLSFIGYGGATTPFNTNFEPKEEEIKTCLDRLASKAKGDLVLVTHMPPLNTAMDKIQDNKHVGSKTISDFILKNKPLLALSAHIHESVGVDRVGRTTLFYPGPLYEGKYGIIKIDGKTIKCETRKIKIETKQTSRGHADLPTT